MSEAEERPPLARRLHVLGPATADERVAAAAETYRVSLRPPRPGEPPLRVSGRGELQPLLDKVLGANHVVVTRVSGDSLTAWHTHNSDQVLVVTGGVATIAFAEGEHRLLPGSVMFVPAGFVHRHGAGDEHGAETVFFTATGHDTVVTEAPFAE